MNVRTLRDFFLHAGLPLQYLPLLIMEPNPPPPKYQKVPHYPPLCGHLDAAGLRRCDLSGHSSVIPRLSDGKQSATREPTWLLLDYQSLQTVAALSCRFCQTPGANKHRGVSVPKQHFRKLRQFFMDTMLLFC